MVDFSEFMNVPIGQMVRHVLPEGHYFGRVKSAEPKESSEKKKPMLHVTFTLDSAGEDVDPASLPANGIANKAVSAFWMMDSDFGQDDIRKFILACGVEVDPAQGWGQYVPATINQPVKLFIQPGKRNKDDTSPDAEMSDNIRKVLPVA